MRSDAIIQYLSRNNSSNNVSKGNITIFGIACFMVNVVAARNICISPCYCTIETILNEPAYMFTMLRLMFTVVHIDDGGKYV